MRTAITALVLTSSVALGHYANMGLDGISCYIYNGIAGTAYGHMIVRNGNGTWYDHDDLANSGNITVVTSQEDYDKLPIKTKIGIVCAPDSLDTTGLGVPYVEMEPTDEEFYATEPTVYTRTFDKRWGIVCIIKFCSASPETTIQIDARNPKDRLTRAVKEAYPLT